MDKINYIIGEKETTES